MPKLSTIIRLITYMITGIGFMVLLSSTFLPPPFTQTSVSDYIDKYKGIAILEMERTGIPASITLGQGILESNFGNSYLAQKANNHFGFKCRKDWLGKVLLKYDDKADDCFRKYNHVYESFIDHSFLLTSGKRYAGLFAHKPNDYRAWAQGLQEAHYASSKRYAQFLVNIIDFYGLHYYDTSTYQKYTIHPQYIDLLNNYKLLYASNAEAKKIEPTSSTLPVSDTNNFSSITKEMTKTENNLYTVQTGDTLFNIARKFNTTVEILMLVNKLKSTNIKIGKKLKIPN